MRRAAVVCVALFALLVGCQSDADNDADDATDEATPAVEPTWPTDCLDVGDMGSRATFFDDEWPVDENDDSPTPAFDGGTTKLWCEWTADDGSSLTIVVATGDADDVDAGLDALEEDGYTCEEDYDGWVCTLDWPASMTLEDGTSQPVAATNAVFGRDHVWVSIDMLWMSAEDATDT
ncbi:MAG: hypothetical protein FWD11_03330, partial [Micrococcales bacterium]|nr:hypothetical protein [Micrococcales bacterium]